MKPVVKILLGLLTVGAGIYLLLSMGALSFWYMIAVLEILIAGVAGFVNSQTLGALALPPMVVITPLVLSANVWNKESLGVLVALTCMWTCIVVSLLGSRTRAPGPVKKTLLISSAALALGFATDRIFTNRIQLHDYEMEWAVGSNDPLGTGPEKFDDQLKVIVYRKQGDATCYDALYSNQLANYVAALKKPRVHVQYEVFYDFGKSRGYNIRSIEGMEITRNSRPVLKVANSEGGTVEGPNATGQCDR